MTIADREVPFRQLVMIMPRKHIDKQKPLRDGYRYTKFKDTMKEDWAQLQYAVGLFATIEDAKNTLESFLKDRKTFEKRFLFVVDLDNELVGSAGLWPGTYFDGNRLRLHYVAVREDAQHHGIGSSMIMRLCKMYDSIPGKYPLYLVTQTSSYGAVALYHRLGFTPYLGAYNGCTSAESEKNWALATQVLRMKAGR